MSTFVQARHYTATTGRQIDLIVIHDMEAPEGPYTAENVARYFATTKTRASAHWCFDDNSAVRCVRDKDVAYHAPGANHNGLGYEHAGYARQTLAEWLDDYSQACLRMSAIQAAADCATYGLPIKFVDEHGLRARQRGITTHWEVTKAFGRSSHTDPGPNFPMDVYLGLVVAAGNPTPTPPEDDTVKLIDFVQDTRPENGGAVYLVLGGMVARHLKTKDELETMQAHWRAKGANVEIQRWNAEINLDPVLAFTASLQRADVTG